MAEWARRTRRRAFQSGSILAGILILGGLGDFCPGYTPRDVQKLDKTYTLPYPKGMTSSGVYTIAEVEAMTGLSAEVLRQWERRYGFPKPRRTPGGHRLYSAEDVEALKTIKRWLEEGATPKAAIRRYLAQEVRPEDLGTGLLEALLRGDLAGAEALFRRGLRFWGPEGVLEHLLLPVLREVGEAWHCLLYTSPSPRDRQKSRMPSSA